MFVKDAIFQERADYIFFSSNQLHLLFFLPELRQIEETNNRRDCKYNHDDTVRF